MIQSRLYYLQRFSLRVLLAAYLTLEVTYELLRANILAILRLSVLPDAVGALLPVVTIVFPNLSLGISAFEYLIALWICMVTTQKVGEKATFFPRIQKQTFYWETVIFQWLLFVYFLAILGVPSPFLFMLSPWLRVLTVFGLALLSPMIIILLPWYVGLMKATPAGPYFSNLRPRPILTTILAFPAALAMVFRAGFIFELFVLLGLLIRPFSEIFGWKVDVEERLMVMMTRINDGSRGFALCIVILSGLYLSSWAAGQFHVHLTFLYTVLAIPGYHPYYPPFLLAFILVVLIAGVAIFLWIRLSLLEWSKRPYLSPLWIALSALLIEVLLINWIQSFNGGSNFELALSNPVIFAVALSASVVIIAELHHWGAPTALIFTVKMAGVILVLLVYFRSQITSELQILAIPVLAYSLSPLMERIGRYVGNRFFGGRNQRG